MGLPTGLFAGPIFSGLAQDWLRPAGAPVDIEAAEARLSESTSGTAHKNPPDLKSVLITILLPPMLMLGRSVAELAKPAGTIRQAIDFLGDPITALLIALFFSIIALGFRRGWSRERRSKSLEIALPRLRRSFSSLGPAAASNKCSSLPRSRT